MRKYKMLVPALKWIRNTLVTIYVFLIMIIYPVYTKNGFVHISTGKQIFFYNTGFYCLLPALVLHLILIAVERKKADGGRTWKACMRSPDGFVLGYFVVLVVSSCLSEFHREAVLGADTWFMGLLSQGLFCLSFYLLSRCFVLSEEWLYGLLFSSGLVFVLCILNRFHIDPLNFYDGRDERFWNAYISTLGQKNWFACYAIIALSVGCGMFLVKTERTDTVFLSVYLYIAFAAAVMQDSDSIYVGILFMMLFLFLVYCRTWRGLYRFFSLLFIALSSCQILGVAQRIWQEHLVSHSHMPIFICQSTVMRILFLAVTLIWLTVGWINRKGSTARLRETEKYIRYFKRAVAGLAVFTVAGLVLLICLVTRYRDTVDFGSLADSKFFYFDDAWGTYRGINWKYAVHVIREGSVLRKLLGIGPDCFQAYAIQYHPDFSREWSTPICNAHNELLTELVNVGLLGAVCYYGIFLSSLYSIRKSRKKHPLALALAAGVVGSMCNNLFSFMNGLSTPLLFIVLGFLRGFALDAQKDGGGKSGQGV